MNNSNLVIFDTTLRDGEQSPGASMNTSEIKNSKAFGKIKRRHY